MNITVSAEIEVTDYDKMFEKWCKDELTVDNPEYNKKIKMGFWVGNTPKTLDMYRKNDDTIYLPRGLGKEVISIFSPENVYIGLNDDKKFDFGKAMIPLYEYQQKAVEYMTNEY